MSDNALVLTAGWGRSAASRVAPLLRLLRQRRDWLYLAYTAAVLQRLAWGPGIGLLTPLLLPVTALTTARITQRETLHRAAGGALLALALFQIARAGSRSAHALHDPLFWGVATIIALGASAVTRRWPAAAAITSALAGACATVAILMPVFPGFESTFPTVTLEAGRRSFSALSNHIGVFGSILLAGIWLQGIAADGTWRNGGRLGAAARGALLAGLILVLAGAAPEGALPAGWIVALGLLLGLVEAKARPQSTPLNGQALWHRLNPEYWQPITVLLLLELLFALLLLHAPGTGDVRSFWITWSNTMVTNGLVEGYRLNNTDYPPLSAIMLLAIAKAALGSSASLFICLKISLVVLLVVATLCFWRWTSDVLLSGLLAFSLFISGIALGYVDLFYAPTLILSLWALQQRRLALFSTCFAVTCLIKWQPLIVAPFLLLHAASIASRPEQSESSPARRWVALVAPASGLVLLMLAMFHVGPVVRSLGRALQHTYLSGTALNFNWLVTYFLHLYNPEQYGPLTDGIVTIIHVNLQLPWVRLIQLAFALFYAAALWRLFRSRQSFTATVECALAGYLSYFMVNIGVHENHLFIGTVLAVAAAASGPGKTVRAFLVVVMSNLNLITFYGLTGAPLDFAPVVGIDVSVIFAAVNVLLFLVFWGDVVSPKTLFARSRPASSPAAV